MKIAPLLGGDFRKAALHQRLAGGDDLDHGGMAGFKIALDRGDQRRGLHRGDQVAEEALLGALERRARRRLGLAVERAGLAGDIGRFQGGIEIVVDDLEGARIGVVDAHLLGGELLLDQFVGDALVGQRAGRIEAERLEVAGQHLHGGDATSLDRLDEFRAGGERKVRPAPQAEPLRIGEIVHRGGAGRRHVEHAGVGQRMLQPQAGAALLRRRLVAALALAAAGVLQGVALVEHDDAIEVCAQPIDDLLHARNLGLAGVGAQRGVGGEQDAVVEPDRRSLREPRQRRDEQAFLAERRPVALGVLDQLVGFRHPHRLAAAFEPIVEQDAGDLAALAGPGAVAEKPAAAEPHRILRAIGRGGDGIEGLVHGP